MNTVAAVVFVVGPTIGTGVGIKPERGRPRLRRSTTIQTNARYELPSAVQGTQSSNGMPDGGLGVRRLQEGGVPEALNSLGRPGGGVKLGAGAGKAEAEEIKTSDVVAEVGRRRKETGRRTWGVEAADC